MGVLFLIGHEKPRVSVLLLIHEAFLMRCFWYLTIPEVGAREVALPGVAAPRSFCFLCQKDRMPLCCGDGWVSA